MLWFSMDERNGNYRFPLRQRESWQARPPRPHSQLVYAKAPGGFLKCGCRPSVRPATAQGHTQAKTESAGFACGVAHVIQHRRTQEWLIDQVFRWVVDHLWINEGQLRSADAICLHLFQFAADLWLFNRQAEPPPPHHGPGVVRWMLEPGLQLRNRCLRSQLGCGQCARQNSGKAPGKQKRITSPEQLSH